MHPLDRASNYLTRVQSTLREARNRNDADLLAKAARMLDEDTFDELPQHAQDGLMEQYIGVAMYVSGGLA